MKFEILKKTLALAMVLVSIGAFASCGKKDSGKDKADSDISVADDAEIEDEDKEDADEDEDENAPEHKIDLDALKAIEDEDEFDVKIIKKDVQIGGAPGISLVGNDACNLTIKNGTDETITDITVYIVGYDKNKGLYQMGDGTVRVIDFGQKQTYAESYITADGTEIEPGKSDIMIVRCDKSKFEGVQAIVASYKTTDGKEYTNPIAGEWVESIEYGQNVVLD